VLLFYPGWCSCGTKEFVQAKLDKLLIEIS